MAGGKETPRQKLIGLMYLVLLAMLALQVSSAIIQKFEFLNSSLEGAIISASERNSDRVESIKALVEKNPNYKDVLKTAEEVRKICKGRLEEIDKLKQEIITITGGINPENKSYNGAKDEDKLAQVMVGDKSTGKKGKAYALQASLNNLVKELEEIAKKSSLTVSDKTFAPLAQDGKDDPLTKNDKEQKNKDFAELNFAHTPMIAGLAVLSDKQAKIVSIESAILGSLAEKVGAKDFKFDVISAMYSAESKVVAAGTEYVADMFVSARSSAIKPTMKFRGAVIPVTDGVGKIKFKAQAANYDADGNSKQNWEGEVIMPKPTGEGDTVFKVKGEYIVAKPVIDVKSSTVSALYYNCGNDLNIQVPALGATYNPSFSATGANVITGRDKGKVIIIPRSKGKVVINVSSEGSAIGKVELDVRPVPKPTIAAMIGGNVVNQKVGVPAPGPQNLQVSAIPEPSFKEALPREARYRVVEGEVTLARGKREILNQSITSDFVNLSSIRAQAQSGDRLIVVVKRVQRANYKDEIEDVAINPNNSFVTIPLQ